MNLTCHHQTCGSKKMQITLNQEENWLCKAPPMVTINAIVAKVQVKRMSDIFPSPLTRSTKNWKTA